MSYFGNTKIGKMFLGDTEIAKAYLGNDLVFQKGGSPTPPVPPGPPAGVVFYDRLVFDGTAFIETDIVPDANASFKVNLGNEILKAGQRLFMVPATVGTIGAILSPSGTTSTNRKFSVYYAASSAVHTSTTLVFSTPTYTFFLTPKRFGFGSNYYTFTKGSGVPNGGIILGSSIPSSRGQAYSGTMGDFLTYGSDAQNASNAPDLADNYTPQYTLRPCTYNGEAGMWCVETSKFYGNTAGAGQLSVLNIS